MKVSSNVMVKNIKQELTKELYELFDNDEINYENMANKLNQCLNKFNGDALRLRTTHLVTRKSVYDIEKNKNKISLYDKNFRSLRHVKTWIKKNIGKIIANIIFIPSAPIKKVELKINVER